MRDRKGGLPYPGGLHRRASDSGAVMTGERYTHLVRLGRDLRALASTALDDLLLLLSEVITNAVTYLDSGRTEGGQVTVRVARVSHAVHVEVTDAGSATRAPIARVAEADSDAGGDCGW
jgi:anti-sigma regulatory factor (Ser/Thr protein kinase)